MYAFLIANCVSCVLCLQFVITSSLWPLQVLVFWPCAPVVTCNYTCTCSVIAFNELNDDGDKQHRLVVLLEIRPKGCSRVDMRKHGVTPWAAPGFLS